MSSDKYKGTIADPSSQNSYAYCGNNPINAVDPSGFETIIISGGDYSDESVHAGYSYNFIETALAEVIETRKANKDENIAWLIIDQGWSDDDWENFSKAVEKLNINIVGIKNTEELISYINNKTGSDSRANDRITKFVVFSHGFKGVLSLGFNYTQESHNIDIYINTIDNIDANAFNKPISVFYSCNTGTGGSNSFAQAWVNKVGGVGRAFEGKSTYQYIMYPRNYFGVFNKAGRFLGISPWNNYKKVVQGYREDYGFSKMGSLYSPQAGDGARLGVFVEGRSIYL